MLSSAAGMSDQQIAALDVTGSIARRCASRSNAAYLTEDAYSCGLQAMGSFVSAAVITEWLRIRSVLRSHGSNHRQGPL